MNRGLERCFLCDELTGRAGRADDSLYDALENGPYCINCWQVAEPLSSHIEHCMTQINEARDALKEARFRPLGDNHHNAAECPYCSGPIIDANAELREENIALREENASLKGGE